jgi:hypothetical protein
MIGWRSRRQPFALAIAFPIAFPSAFGDPILDDPQQVPNEPGPAPRTPPESPPGLREQLAATIAAGLRIGRAHVALARAEFAGILAEGQRVGILAGIAAALVLFVLLLVPVGGTLFVGEWLFGSIGWGLLLGSELAIGAAVLLVLNALYVPADLMTRRLVIALLAGIAVAVVLAFNLPHQAFTTIGSSALTSIDPGPRPLVVGLLVGAGIGAIVGLVLGIVGRRGIGGTIGAAIGLAVLLLIVGALVAIDYSPAVTVAIGLAVMLAVWPALVAIDTRRRGVDLDKLKSRFYPRLTVETTKETIEWLQTQRPLGPKS